MELLLNDGVIKLLIRHIQLKIEKDQLLIRHTEEENAAIRKKRKTGSFGQYKDAKVRKMLTTCLTETTSFYRNEAATSPAGRFSIGSSCSSSSGYSSEEFENGKPEAFDYSPVCSDAEDEETTPPGELDETAVEESPPFDFTTLMLPEDSTNDFCTSDHGDLVCNEPITQLSEFKENFLQCLLELVNELSRQKGSLFQRADFIVESTLNGLIKAFNASFCAQTLVTKILKNILR